MPTREELEDEIEENNERDPLEDQHWREVFNRYDANGDGMISLPELCTAIREDKNINNIPEEAVKQIMLKSDEDNNGFLSFDEFVKMIQHPDYHSIFGHLSNMMANYIGLAAPRKKGSSGEYEKAYTCWPPALGMVIIGTVEVIMFLYEAIYHNELMARGPIARKLMFHPKRREEAWRYISYMFVHVGVMHLVMNVQIMLGIPLEMVHGSWRVGTVYNVMHLVMNLIVQIMLGIPLEMVHGSWRVGTVYLAGVLAGSLGTSVITPTAYLAGASGGVYALITAHVATIIMNWKEMAYPVYQLLVFFVWIVVDIRSAVDTHLEFQDKDTVGHMSHLFGAIAGLLVGINVLKNLDVLQWERVLSWASISIFGLGLLVTIIWSLAFPSYFLESAI